MMYIGGLAGRSKVLDFTAFGVLPMHSAEVHYDLEFDGSWVSKEMNYATTMVSHSIELLQVYPCVFHLKGLVQVLQYWNSFDQLNQLQLQGSSWTIWSSHCGGWQWASSCLAGLAGEWKSANFNDPQRPLKTQGEGLKQMDQTHWSLQMGQVNLNLVEQPHAQPLKALHVFFQIRPTSNGFEKSSLADFLSVLSGLQVKLIYAVVLERDATLLDAKHDFEYAWGSGAIHLVITGSKLSVFLVHQEQRWQNVAFESSSACGNLAKFEIWSVRFHTISEYSLMNSCLFLCTLRLWDQNPKVLVRHQLMTLQTAWVNPSQSDSRYIMPWEVCSKLLDGMLLQMRRGQVVAISEHSLSSGTGSEMHSHK